MALDLVNYELKAREAIQAFWGNRDKARQKQLESGNADAGERGSVTAGKNMDGFVALVIELVRANGLAIGTAHDLWTAYREGAFGKHPKPFVGWLMLVEDAPGSRSSVRDASPHFPVFPEFQGASYLQRYNLLCQRLVQEQLYTTASIITSPRTAAADGQYAELDELTSLRTLVTSLAGHVAAEAARQQ